MPDGIHKVVLADDMLPVADQVIEQIENLWGGWDDIMAAVKLAPIRDASGKLLPSVTISIGGALLQPGATTATSLMAAADANLYASKQNGRDRVTL